MKILRRQSRQCLFATQSAPVFISLSLSHINKISKFLQHFFFVKDLVIQLPLYKARQKLSNKLSCSFTSGIKEGSSRITSWNYRTFGSGCGSIRYILRFFDGNTWRTKDERWNWKILRWHGVLQWPADTKQAAIRTCRQQDSWMDSWMVGCRPGEQLSILNGARLDK